MFGAFLVRLLDCWGFIQVLDFGFDFDLFAACCVLISANRRRGIGDRVWVVDRDWDVLRFGDLLLLNSGLIVPQALLLLLLLSWIALPMAFVLPMATSLETILDRVLSFSALANTFWLALEATIGVVWLFEVIAGVTSLLGVVFLAMASLNGEFHWKFFQSESQTVCWDRQLSGVSPEHCLMNWLVVQFCAFYYCW